MAIKIEGDVILSSKKFLPAFAVTWLFIVLGAVLSLIFILLAGLFQKNSLLYFFTQNLGIFIFFTSILAGYSGVYRIVNSDSETAGIRASIKDSFKGIRIIAAAAFMTGILFSAIVLIETGFSMVSMVPYAGPSLMALLTAPIFLLNLTIVAAAICVFAVIPSIVDDTEGFKNIALETRKLLMKDWLKIILYLLISLSIFALCSILIFMVVRYAGGITKAVQWKVMLAYPPSMKNLVTGSYFSDVIYKLVPSSNPAAAIQQYGNEIVDYMKIIKHIITVSYLLVITFVSSFPLAVYFSISSVYFKSLRKSA